MKRLVALLAVVVASTPGFVWAQDTIKEFSLKDGVNDENGISQPIFDTSAMAPVYIGAIERSYDPKVLMFRKGGSSSAWVGAGPQYYVDARIDLAGFLREALEKQGAAMGLKMAKSPEGAWVLTGALKDIHFVTEQTGGATLFYGTTQVELGLRDPEGKTSTHDLDLNVYKAIRRKGFRRGGRANEALALSLVETAHEIFSNLQMSTWRLPLHATTGELAKNLESASLNGIYRLGLTGSSEIGSRLLSLLPQRQDADHRFIIIEALGRLRFAESVETLGQRYAAEDEDCRWATVKALSYIEGDRALAVVKERGTADDYVGAKRLATEVLARP